MDKKERQRQYDKSTGYAAQKRYEDKYCKRYNIKCTVRTEHDIIERLDGLSNKSGYIKQLIRKDKEIFKNF